jgi:hypothetical protein
VGVQYSIADTRHKPEFSDWQFWNVAFGRNVTNSQSEVTLSELAALMPTVAATKAA